MSIPLFFRRDLASLRAACPAAEEAMRKVGMGQIVEVEIKRPRNLLHHRKWWALLQIVADNMTGVTAEQLNQVIKIRTGHVDVIKTKKGIIELPKSISFAAMDQTAFEAFFDKAVAFICSEIIPNLGRDELLAEVESILAGRAG
jgi:hypothetical protein